MVLRMARPTRRSDSSFFVFRKRVPGDIRAQKRGGYVVFCFPGETPDAEPIKVTGAIGAEIKFSLKTRDPDIAKARQGLAEAHRLGLINGHEWRRGLLTAKMREVA